MTLLKIARLGHPVLRQIARPVADPADPAVGALVRDMLETMRDAEGVGLAAPQVHAGLRVIVLRVPADRGEAVGETALINPELEPIGDDMSLGWEGCLSIPGLRGAVPRFARLRYRGFAPDGTPREGLAEGFHARVLQHEVDHLDGILYLDRMIDLRSLTFEDQFKHAPPLARLVTPEPDEA